ncbi:hypothetical protein NEUTE2DRAFT_128763 [Neurospora tetrasperma FGSC 2509]|nr:hypothetical protein NEUTE2DRAFT_128763 [Neurospora tetrasperma FGSC 2509]
MHSCVLPGERGCTVCIFCPSSPQTKSSAIAALLPGLTAELTSQEAQTQTAGRLVAQGQLEVEATSWPFLSVANRNRLAPVPRYSHGKVAGRHG